MQEIPKKETFRNMVIKNPVSLAFEDFFGLLLNFLKTKKLYLNSMNIIIGMITVTNGKKIRVVHPTI